MFRFTKLQDALGERLLPATLQQLAEPFEDWPMRDRLNRLEKLGFLNVVAAHKLIATYRHWQQRLARH